MMGALADRDKTKKGIASKSMHGATVVPEAAFLKHRKLLEKKKRWAYSYILKLNWPYQTL